MQLEYRVGEVLWLSLPLRRCVRRVDRVLKCQDEFLARIILGVDSMNFGIAR